jgi:hypothetical protein
MVARRCEWALALQAIQFSVIAIPEAPPKILGSTATRVGRNESKGAFL